MHLASLWHVARAGSKHVRHRPWCKLMACMGLSSAQRARHHRGERERSNSGRGRGIRKGPRYPNTEYRGFPYYEIRVVITVLGTETYMSVLGPLGDLVSTQSQAQVCQKLLSKLFQRPLLAAALVQALCLGPSYRTVKYTLV